MTTQAARLKQQQLQDVVFRGATRFFAFLVLAILAGIIISLCIGAWPSIKQFGLGFLVSDQWNPVTHVFGGRNSIIGTLLSSLIALLIAVPVSFGIAIFLTELAPVWLRRPFGIAIELLAGVPSIIYGIWGLFIFAPWFGDNVQPWLQRTTHDIPLLGTLFDGPPMGIGMLTSGLILSIMIIPYISSVMRDVFEVVPAMLKESAYGLGCTTWEVMWNVVLPFTRSGVIGGVMLGLGRALGETMAITFVIGNSHSSIHSLFDPGTSIAATLANEFTEASDDLHVASLIYLGLLLFVITFVVLVLSKILLLRLQKGDGAHS
ncbi:phosphate transport system permease protein [Andreprevotia lacus DSM 23236]|jgi:phosphate transport system permease protein|uniref:Phosphate transport system permease protein n=1 Tax=Andreprevotia lacus DSM 23236 TaxID=1121001 RepID=A0A1W1WZN9_9NEIS|nr:phosphate ABC transporter permease subunit PstC [Andreprevotia lacus]SMC17115.1 phosphate transport system permease protein [Andreprevotia lacus DSM 23236]